MVQRALPFQYQRGHVGHLAFLAGATCGWAFFAPVEGGAACLARRAPWRETKPRAGVAGRWGMLNADADYARMVLLLSKQQLAPYVSYVKTDTVDGLGKHKDSGRIVVRVSDGAIVSGASDEQLNVSDYRGHYNPITHPPFDPACYRATAEADAEYDGGSALKFTLAAVCKNRPGDNDYPFTTLYVDPDTMHPLDVTGTAKPTDDNKDVSISLDLHYRDFGGRVLPASVKVDVSGAGWMFWLQVHVTETYADYRFSNSPT